MIKLNKEWKFKEKFPTIGAYTTTYNCCVGEYPFVESIKSFAWCDSVYVLDGGSTDGTKEILEKLKDEMPNLKVYNMPLDLSNPLKDGEQKAFSRAMVSEQFCLQFDVDEFCKGDVLKWKRVAKEMPDNVSIMSLLVLEPFGDMNNIRINKEHNPAKWRVSRNDPAISHGLFNQDKAVDEHTGKVYSRGLSDGCFPINLVSNELMPSHMPRYLQELIKLKNEGKNLEYADGVREVLSSEPYVLHVGHVDLNKKIRLYLNSWHNWWCCLYNKDPEDPANNLYFPGVLPKDVTDDMIKSKVNDLFSKTESISLNYA